MVKFKMAATLKGGKHVVTFEKRSNAIWVAQELGAPFLEITRDSDLAVLESLGGVEGTVVWVQPGAFGVPMRIPNIGLVVSDLYQVQRFDEKLGIYVTRKQYVDEMEVSIQHGYAEAGGVDMLIRYDKGEMYELAKCRSWLVGEFADDPIWRALDILSAGPKKKPISDMPWPLRDLELQVMRLQLNTLVSAGLMEPLINQVQYKRGCDELVKKLLSLEPRFRRNARAACMLMAMLQSKATPRAKRVAIRMALAAADPDWVRLPAKEHTNLYKYMEGPGRRFGHRGYIWVLLGLWEFGCRKFKAYEDGQTGWAKLIVGRGEVKVCLERCTKLMRSVDDIEKAFKLDGTSEDWAKEPMINPAELEAIDRAMMRAWFWNLVMLPIDGSSSIIFSALARAKLCPATTMLPNVPEDTMASPPGRRRLGLATSFEWCWKEGGGELMACGVTLLPLAYAAKIPAMASEFTAGNAGVLDGVYHV